jgi:hypothetical protein
MQKSGNLFGFSFSEIGSGASVQGALGDEGGWESEAHRGFNGTRCPGMGPTNQQLGPAIDYGNLLGLNLCSAMSQQPSAIS